MMNVLMTTYLLRSHLNTFIIAMSKSMAGISLWAISREVWQFLGSSCERVGSYSLCAGGLGNMRSLAAFCQFAYYYIFIHFYH